MLTFGSFYQFQVKEAHDLLKMKKVDQMDNFGGCKHTNLCCKAAQAYTWHRSHFVVFKIENIECWLL